MVAKVVTRVGLDTTATHATAAVLTVPTAIKRDDLIIIYAAAQCGVGRWATNPVVGYEVGAASNVDALPFGTFTFLRRSDGTEGGTTVTVDAGTIVAAAMLVRRGDFWSVPLNTTPQSNDVTLVVDGGTGVFVDRVSNNAVLACDTFNLLYAAGDYPIVPPVSLSIIAAGAVNNDVAATCTVSGGNWVKTLSTSISGGGKRVFLTIAEDRVDTGGTPTAAVCTFTWTQSMTRIRALPTWIATNDPDYAVKSQWNPYVKGQPTNSTEQQLRQLRQNLYAINLGSLSGVPLGWDYSIYGSTSAPDIEYWSRGSGITKEWVMQMNTYSGGDIVKVALYYSNDNQKTYVPMTDEGGNFVAAITYDGSHHVQTITWRDKL